MKRLTGFNPTTIIFDMDGVLVDSEFWWCQFEDEFYPRIMPGWEKKDHHQIIGQSLTGIYKFFIEQYDLNLSWPQFRKAYMDQASKIYQEQVDLMPGAKKLLADIYTRGQTLALASSSFHSWIEMVVTRFDLKKYFKAIVSSQDVGQRGKPAPDIYLYTARQLHVEPKDCLVIEDSTNGVLSAKAAGMTAIAYKSPRNPEQDYSQADLVINDLGDLKSVVSTKANG